MTAVGHFAHYSNRAVRKGVSAISGPEAEKNLVKNSNKPVERRKHKRFRISQGAIVGLRPRYLRLGRVTNIGIDGLAFSYVADEALPNLSSELDVFLSMWGFHLYGVPFNTIWDFETNGVGFSSIRTRRSGLQFGQLGPDQMSRLEYLIENHTTGEI